MDIFFEHWAIFNGKMKSEGAISQIGKKFPKSIFPSSIENGMTSRGSLSVSRTYLLWGHLQKLVQHLFACFSVFLFKVLIFLENIIHHVGHLFFNGNFFWRVLVFSTFNNNFEAIIREAVEPNGPPADRGQTCSCCWGTLMSTADSGVCPATRGLLVSWPWILDSQLLRRSSFSATKRWFSPTSSAFLHSKDLAWFWRFQKKKKPRLDHDSDMKK